MVRFQWLVAFSEAYFYALVAMHRHPTYFAVFERGVFFNKYFFLIFKYLLL